MIAVRRKVGFENLGNHCEGNTTEKTRFLNRGYPNPGIENKIQCECQNYFVSKKMLRSMLWMVVPSHQNSRPVDCQYFVVPPSVLKEKNIEKLTIQK